MNLNSADVAVYCALLAFFATAVLDEAFRPDKRTRFTGRLVTQRQRYAKVLFAESLFMTADVWLLVAESPGKLWLVARDLLGAFGSASLLLDAGLVWVPINLIAVPLTFLYIYRRPVVAAYWSRSHEGYCPTAWCRDGYRGFVPESQLWDLEGLGTQEFAGIEPQDFGAPPT